MASIFYSQLLIYFTAIMNTKDFNLSVFIAAQKGQKVDTVCKSTAVVSVNPLIIKQYKKFLKNHNQLSQYAFRCTNMTYGNYLVYQPIKNTFFVSNKTLAAQTFVICIEADLSKVRVALIILAYLLGIPSAILAAIKLYQCVKRHVSI